MRIPTRAVLAVVALSSNLLFLSACGPSSTQSSTPKEAWNAVNDPGRFGVGTSTLADIPQSASIDNGSRAWSGDYWPTYKGGISYRWQTSGSGDSYLGYLYDVIPSWQMSTLSSAQIDGLSPAEKYDIYLGRDTFPLVTSEKQHVQSAIRNGDVPSWYGICHGWAAAAYREPEPGASAYVRAPSGISVNFNHSDLEALMSYLYGNLQNGATKLIGSRCDSENIATDANGRALADECRDVNPATFHLVLAEYIGRQKRSFLADINRDAQVWNYPIVGYQFHYSNQRPLDANDPLLNDRAPGTATLVDVSVDLTHVAGAELSRTPNGTRTDVISIFYTLELDTLGRIIGGEWKGEGHPDFLWDVLQSPATSRSSLVDYETIKSLFALSRGNAPNPDDPHDPVDPNDPNNPSNPPPPSSDPSLLSFTRWDVSATAVSRAVIVVEGKIDTTRATEVRLFLVRPNGDRALVASAWPASNGLFSIQNTFAPRFVNSIVVEAVNSTGHVLLSQSRPVSL